MIGAVLFDFDGVLTTDPSGSTTTIGYLAAVTGLPEADLWNAFAPFNDDLLLGLTTHAIAWPGICERLGHPLDFALLEAAFEATPLNRPMLELAMRLRERHAVGMITDNKRDRIDRLVQLHQLDRTFAPIVVSADCGSGKSDVGIFRRALSLLGLPPQRTVFIDNSRRNLLAAQALEMNTIHFDDARNDVPGLAALLRERFGLSL